MHGLMSLIVQEEGFNIMSDFNKFKDAHERFVNKRKKNLDSNAEIKRVGIIITYNIDPESVIYCMAKAIQKGIIELHNDHHECNCDKKISVGIVRMANIKPLVALIRKLLSMDVPESDTEIHYCAYHSKYPLAIRSHLENKLDRILDRHSPEDIWKHPEILEKIKNSHTKNHIFVVIASPIAEVGRDHDYDWGIIEPSSMRSIIQLAGRILRHRSKVVTKPNVMLLNKNYKSMIGKTPCFTKPGFEIEGEGLECIGSHDLLDILSEEQYNKINAIPRIVGIEEKELKNRSWSNLVELEHKALTCQLFSGNKPAKFWWKKNPHWCGEMQRQQPFRKSEQEDPYYLFIKNKNSAPEWKWKNEHVSPPKFGEVSSISIKRINLDNFGKGNDFWFNIDAVAIYEQLAEDFKADSLEEVSRRFGELRLREYENKQIEYKYHPDLGVFEEIDE